MEDAPFIRLNLRTPLEYEASPGLVPFESFPRAEGEELLFCFGLDSKEAGSIEPCAGLFLRGLVFSGKGAQFAPHSCGVNDGPLGEPDSGPGNVQLPFGKMSLPAGLYIFAQKREALSRDECINMAIELQKDGLWEGLKLENHLYVRCLYEDSKPVTQVFRPCQ